MIPVTVTSLVQGTNVHETRAVDSIARQGYIQGMTDSPPARPLIRQVVEIVAAANGKGIHAAEIAQHFADGDPARTLKWVNAQLSRAKCDGYIRRTSRRELPPDGDASRRAFRWFVTPAGLEYLHPERPPVITPLDEPPNTRRVLEILTDAGKEGIRGPDIARYFTVPEPDMPSLAHTSGKSQSLQRRLAWTNQILDRFLIHGYVRRGGAEPSPYYHRVPAYRWYVTEEGVQYLADGLAEGRRRARYEREEAERTRLAEHRKRLGDLLTQAYVENDPETTPACQREQVMRKLRDAGCTLHDIGGVFGVTRERARQILEGIRVHPCQCPDCTDKRWFEVGDGKVISD